MTTVADILGARPGLRDRAVAALEEEKVAAKIRFEESAEELRFEFHQFLTGTLECPDLELTDLPISIIRSDPKSPGLKTTLDGVFLLATWERKKVLGKSGSKQFEEEDIFQDVLVVKTPSAGANTWVRIESLADLGKFV